MKAGSMEIPVWEKCNLTIEEASAYSNIGLNKLREMANDVKCPFALHIGKRTLVKRRAFEEYLKNRTFI